MHFDFKVSVDVHRERGKFATRDEIAEKLREAIEQANPGEVQGDNEGEYTVDDWAVEDA